MYSVIRNPSTHQVSVITNNHAVAQYIIATQGIRIGDEYFIFSKAGYQIDQWTFSEVVNYVHNEQEKLSDEEDINYRIASKAAGCDIEKLIQSGVLQSGGVFRLSDGGHPLCSDNDVLQHIKNDATVGLLDPRCLSRSEG